MVVRTAVVGAGTISRTHLAGVSKNPRTELTAVCDLDEAAARARAREFGTMAVTDLTSILEDLDAIHICTPAQTHFDIARQAIEAGVAVVLEKPATVTVEEVVELEKLATAHDVPATVIHNHLFYPAVRTVRGMIERGELGRIRGIDVVYAGLTPPDQVNRGSWVFELPGGEFEEGLPHPIYTTLGLAGFPESAESISAQTSLSKEYDGGFSYDQAQVGYVSEHGTLCSITMLSGTQQQRMHIIDGSEASVVVDEVNQSVFRIDDDYTASTVARSRKGVDLSLSQLASTVENAKLVVDKTLDDSWETAIKSNSHFAIFDEFAKAVDLGTEVPVPLEQSRWTIRMMEEIRSAAQDVPAVDAGSGSESESESAPEESITVEQS